MLLETGTDNLCPICGVQLIVLTSYNQCRSAHDFWWAKELSIWDVSPLIMSLINQLCTLLLLAVLRIGIRLLQEREHSLKSTWTENQARHVTTLTNLSEKFTLSWLSEPWWENIPKARPFLWWLLRAEVDRKALWNCYKHTTRPLTIEGNNEKRICAQVADLAFRMMIGSNPLNRQEPQLRPLQLQNIKETHIYMHTSRKFKLAPIHTGSKLVQSKIVSSPNEVNETRERER